MSEPPRKKLKANHVVDDTAQTGFLVGPESFIQALRQLPKELLSRILQLLHPRDLLPFSKAYQVFNYFLASEGEFMWRFVRENADDVPDRPPFLSESTFASLLFSPHCHHCASIVQEINWEWYARVCKSCLPNVSYGADDIRLQMRGWSKLLPKGDHLERLFDAYSLPPDSSSQDSMVRTHFYKPQVDRFLARLPSTDITHSHEALAKAQQLFKEFAGNVWERLTYRGNLQQWSIDQGQPDREVVLKARQEQRLNEIIERLRNSDWAGEIDYLDRLGILASSLSKYPAVRQSVELTEYGWLRVDEALTTFLKSMREQRRKIYKESFSNLEEAIVSHCVQIPRNAAMDCRPRFIDLAMYDDVRALIENPDTTVVSAAAFSTLVPSLVDRWHAECRKELTDFFRPHLGPIPDDVDPLSLATAAVACSWCFGFSEYSVFKAATVNVLRYPAILAHDCARRIICEEMEPPPEVREDFYAYTAMTACPAPVNFRDSIEENLGAPDLGAPFSVARVTTFNSRYKATFERMREVISALGLDPSRATMEDVRQCKARLRFTTYDPWTGWESSSIESGESALRHILRENGDTYSKRIEWKRVGGADLETAHAMEAAEWKRLSLSTEEVRWACSLCATWLAGPDDPVDELSRHLKEEHGIDDPEACVEDGTIYPHPGHSNVFLAHSVGVPDFFADSPEQTCDDT